MAGETEIFANDGATGTLSTGYTSGSTSIVLTTGHGARFPAILAGQQIRVRVSDPTAAIVGGTPPGGEIVVVTAHTAGSDTFTVVRGEESTAIAWSTGWVFEAVLTANAQERYQPSYAWLPKHNNLLGATFDPGQTVFTSTPSAGVEYFGKIWLPEVTYTFTNAIIVIGTAGTGATPLANCFVGLRASDGTLIAKTANQATPWATTGNKIMALTNEAGQSLTQTGGPDVFVWVTFLVGTQATTAVQPGRLGNTTGLVTVGQAAADGFRFATLGSGLTALPSAAAPGSMGSSSFAWWLAVN